MGLFYEDTEERERVKEREREAVGVLLCSFVESDGDGIGRGSLA